MKLEPGDLVLVPFPFTDLSSKKVRPALVVSNATFNRAGTDVVLCAVTSNLENTSHSVLLQAADMAMGALKATSRVKADKVVTVSQTIIRRRVGRAKRPIVGRVMAELSTILAIRGP